MKHLIVIALGLASASFAFADCGACAGDAAHAHDKDGKHAKAAGVTCEDGCCELVSNYEKVSMALAADDLEKAKAAASDLACFAECNGDNDFGAEIAKVADAESLEDARAAFKTVSTTAIKQAGEAGKYFIMTCPMANADWIQTSEEVSNPYYGSKMLRCGAVKKSVTAAM